MSTLSCMAGAGHVSVVAGQGEYPDIEASDAKMVLLNDLSVPETSSPVHCFCEDGCGTPSLRLVTMSLNLLNWSLDHNSPGWNRIAKVGSIWASPEWAIDIGFLCCPGRAWGQVSPMLTSPMWPADQKVLP